uniref:Uncharacterized protein n=1 Tax=Timema douglasi TaxID=61478 RepID=A0A7R8V9H9_TIMDO|nr:unnamed protein product [Timema douglasi]
MPMVMEVLIYLIMANYFIEGCVALLKSEQQFISDVLMRPTPSPVLALYNDGAPLQPSHPQSREAIQGRIKSRGSTHADGDLLIPFLVHVLSPQQDAVSGRWWLTQGPMTVMQFSSSSSSSSSSTPLSIVGSQVTTRTPSTWASTSQARRGAPTAVTSARMTPRMVPTCDPGDDSEDESRPIEMNYTIHCTYIGSFSCSELTLPEPVDSPFSNIFIFQITLQSLTQSGRPLSTEKFLDSSVAYYWCV